VPGLATALVAAVAVFFAGMGVVALGRPERIVAWFGTRHLTIDGRNEVQAVYGGFGLAVAAVLAAAIASPVWRPGVLLAVSVALFGMAVGRLISRAADGSAGRPTWLFFGVEVALGSALWLALALQAVP
jgi:hypothetical protein